MRTGETVVEPPASMRSDRHRERLPSLAVDGALARGRGDARRADAVDGADGPDVVRTAPEDLQRRVRAVAEEAAC